MSFRPLKIRLRVTPVIAATAATPPHAAARASPRREQALPALVPLRVVSLPPLPNRRPSIMRYEYRMLVPAGIHPSQSDARAFTQNTIRLFLRLALRSPTF
jgi:hypothetical protein